MDFKQAQRLLTLVDEDADEFAFVAIHDDKEKRKTHPPVALNGSFDDCKEQLAELNRQGYGIFFVVNETDGKGRKTENIKRIRALWQEADRGDEPALPCQPHATVATSPGRYHRYILVENASLDEFAAVQQRLVDDYGSDPNAKDCARLLRLPGFYHQKNPDKPHLVRLVEESGALPIPWEEAKRLFPPVERRSHRSAGELPPEGTPLVNPAEIWSALQSINPDIGYLEWVRIGMALHSTGAGREAFNLWDTWSARGSSYREGETAYRWSTFSRDRPDGVTIATLFHVARESGWDGSLDTSDGNLLNITEQNRRLLADFNAHHALVMVEGKALIVYFEQDSNVDRMTHRFSTEAEMEKLHRNRFLVDEEAPNAPRGRTPLVKTWMASHTRRTYKQVVFQPVPGLVAGDTRLPDTPELNLYRGLAIQPAPGNCSLILDHIRATWCSGNPVAYDYVLNWLACLFQRPDERGHTVIVLRSGEGSGKNIIIDELVRAFGSYAFVATRSEDLTGRFNDHLATSILVFANEAIWGGNKQAEGALKSLITDVDLPVERKYLPKFRVRNCVHLIMASNNDWVAPISLDDRRFAVFDVSEHRKGDREYFNALASEIKNGGREAFIHQLLQRDICGFNPRVLPDLGTNQATKLNAKIRGTDTATQWLYDCLYSGDIACLDPSVHCRYSASASWEQSPLNFPTGKLFAAYTAWVGDRHQRPESMSVFGKRLKSLISAEVTRPAVSQDPTRPRCYCLPNLAQCRKNFEAALKQPIDWDDAE